MIINSIKGTQIVSRLKKIIDDSSEIIGVLNLSYKSGLDGISWSIRDEIHNEHNIFPLEENDHLIVYDMNGNIIWEGDIHYDLKQNSHQRIVENNKITKQEVFGYWVKWLQKDESPENWAGMFFDHCKAKLIKKTNITTGLILWLKKKLSMLKNN